MRDNFNRVNDEEVGVGEADDNVSVDHLTRSKFVNA